MDLLFLTSGSGTASGFLELLLFLGEAASTRFVSSPLSSILAFDFLLTVAALTVYCLRFCSEGGLDCGFFLEALTFSSESSTPDSSFNYDFFFGCGFIGFLELS